MSTNATVARRGVFDNPSDFAVFGLIIVAVLAVLGVYAVGELAGLITHLALPKVGMANRSPFSSTCRTTCPIRSRHGPRQPAPHFPGPSDSWQRL